MQPGPDQFVAVYVYAAFVGDALTGTWSSALGES